MDRDSFAPVRSSLQKTDPHLPLSSSVTARSSYRLSRCGDDDGDIGDGRSDAHCTCSLGVQNNMNMDSRHMDNSERTGAGSTRRDSNLGSSDTRSSRPEIQN